jgi:uncharacterized protein YpbB
LLKIEALSVAFIKNETLEKDKIIVDQYDRERIKILNDINQNKAKKRTIKKDKPVSKFNENQLDTIIKKPKSKTNTVDATLEMLKENNDLKTIADLRNLALSTIEGHVSQGIQDGRISIFTLVETERIKIISEAVASNDEQGLIGIKTKLGDDYRYGEIRMVVAHIAFEELQKNETLKLNL